MTPPSLYSPYVADPAWFTSVLSLAVLFWCLWGWWMITELWDLAPTRGWKTFLFLFAGPLSWALLTYRALRSARRRVLARYHLPHCGCERH